MRLATHRRHTYEEEGIIVINAELPGVSKDDVTVDIKDNVLTIKGVRNYDQKVEKDSYYRRERCYGKFYRAFSLPDAVDPNRIEASYKDGVLKVKIPRAEETASKKIEIK